MSEMVERVALLLQLLDGDEHEMDLYRHDARAVIEAMRRPTPEMVFAVQDRAECFSFGAELLDSDIRSIFALAIDGALK